MGASGNPTKPTVSVTVEKAPPIKIAMPGKKA